MIYKVNGAEYHLETFGQGEPVLFIHGFTSAAASWESIIHPLTGRFKVILIDVLGHGQSSKPADPSRYQIEQISDDIAKLLENLNIPRVSLVGYSMGGRLALTFAVKHPDKTKALVLESSSPGLRTAEERKMRREKDEKLAGEILNKGISNFVEYWTSIPLFDSQKKLDKSVRDKIYQERLSNDPLGLANSLKGMGTGAQPSWWEELKKIDSPVLLLTGSLDVKFCRIAEDMLASLKNARHVTFFDIGHALHVEDSKKFGTMVMEFLSNVLFKC